MTQGRFALSIAAFVEQTGRNAEEVVRQATLALLGGIIEGSPVDTGRFRGNWQVGLGASPSGVLLVDDKVGAQTKAKGAAVLAAFDAGENIFLTNNIPYSLILEYGRDDGTPGSRQAPNGVVRIAIVQFQQYLERAAAALPKK